MWWIVMDLNIDNNPAWIGLILIGVAFYLAFIFTAIYNGVSINNLFRWPFDLLASTLVSWRSEVFHHLLSDGQQSPIGDYLGLEVLVVLLSKLVEKVVRSMPKFTKRIRCRPLMWLPWGASAAFVLLVNVALTSLLSFVFLTPLPDEVLVRIIYGGIIVAMFATGVWRSILSIRDAFPLTPRIIRDDISRRQRQMRVRGDEIDLLRKYVRRKWRGSQKYSRGLSSKISRRSSWPPSRSRRSIARRTVQGRSIVVR